MNQKEIFKHSYWRIKDVIIDGHGFIDSFYNKFLASEDISNMFVNTDFHLQKDMLVLSLLHLSSFQDIDGAKDVMKELAIRHKKLNIKPYMYQLWFMYIMETVEEYDPEYNEDIAQSWHQTLTSGINFMIAQHNEG